MNLTAATNVHLVEPDWNPMVEAQAASRIDRLDQTKDITIWRYIVRDSIEEVSSVYAVLLPCIEARLTHETQHVRSRQTGKLELAQLCAEGAAANSSGVAEPSSFEVW